MLFLILGLLWFCFISFFRSLAQATSIKLLMLMCKVRFSSFIENNFFQTSHFTETFPLLNLHMKYGFSRLPQERAVCQGRQRRVRYYCLTPFSKGHQEPPSPSCWLVCDGWAGRTLLALTCCKEVPKGIPVPSSPWGASAHGLQKNPQLSAAT